MSRRSIWENQDALALLEWAACAAVPIGIAVEVGSLMLGAWWLISRITLHGIFVALLMILAPSACLVVFVGICQKALARIGRLEKQVRGLGGEPEQ